MNINDLFLKPIDREIEGVIKADDDESLRIEVEEYVVTNEIAKNLSQLFEMYNHPKQAANGVWISGFFGSGKSHLLKMLALLMEDRQVEGLSVLETLHNKIPTSAAMLRAEMKKAVSVPSQSILFNIDQKADAISKSDFDAVLGVFAKVFDEFCGYYGQQGYIASFERELDSQGLFQDFQTAFQDVAGVSWHEGRETFNLNRRKIARAYARLTGNPEDSAGDIIQSYREDYSLSIEDFASNVNDYIQTQPPGFRLNFFVDEVGQYIAENIKLMTNLQTIAESLATICKGRSWLFVTSQDDMTTVLGEFGKKQSNDFSKIQARFQCNIHLSSQDVAEVIQKRLLKKTTDGEAEVKLLYAAEQKNFGTLFSFPDGGMSFRNFRDEAEFVNSYPFIPYQYTLFQQSIETLSKHNAFTGKHSSVGERSMLGVFQDVVKAIKQKKLGTLGAFDLMFEGIRSALKARTLSSIIKAEDHLSNPFAIQLLKVLFMIKYVNTFEATPRNLRVLMQTSFNEDIRALENRINEALGLLERQIYIRRNDTIYEYLTEEEQDIETEIKEVPIENDSVLKILEDLFFIEIIRDNKIRFEGNQQDYPFARRIDGKLQGKDHELVIDFISPFNERAGELLLLKSHSMDKPELLVVLPEDPQFMQDVLMYKKTEQYIKVNHGLQISETKKMILSNKAFHNTERKKVLSRRAAELIGEALFIVAGDDCIIGGEEPKTRVIKAFNQMVARIYPHLRMLGSVTYTENDIRGHLEASQGGLFESDAVALNEAETEVLSFIKANQGSGELTTMKKVVDRYSTRPYGWYLAAIQCVVAMLAGRGKLECWMDGNLLENGPLEKALKNTYGFNNLTLNPVKAPPPGKLLELRSFYRDFFDDMGGETELRALVRRVKKGLGELRTTLSSYIQQVDRYPFVTNLQPIIDRFDQLITAEPDYFIEDFLEGDTEALFDLKESTIDPVINFMNSAKRDIYDQLVDFVAQKKPDINSEDLAVLESYRLNPQVYSGSHLQQARVHLQSIRERVSTTLEDTRKQALAELDSKQASMQSMGEYQRLGSDQQAVLDAAFKQIAETIQSQSLGVSVRDKLHRFTSQAFPDLLSQMVQMAAEEGSTEQGHQPAAQIIPLSMVAVGSEKTLLETEDDVRAYCQVLQQALLAALDDNKRIMI